MSNREKICNISTKDGKTIYGKQIDDLSKPLIVLSHGLTDHMNSREMYNASWFLADKGFSTYRFSYYDGLEDARNITECTPEVHALDLDTVIDYFRNQRVKQIYVVGHSLGALTVFLSKNRDFNGAVLWDPTYPTIDIFKEALLYIKELDSYIIKWGTDYLVSKNMIETLQALKIDDYLKDYAKPTLIVSAGKGILSNKHEIYIQQMKGPKELVVIQEADHNFSNEGTFEELLNVTTSWLKAIT